MTTKPVSGESLERFVETLPRASAGASETLHIKLRSAATARSATAKMLARGFLGCVPFATAGSDEIVLIVRPDIPVDRMPVAIARVRIPDGTTLAPSFRQFVAGRLIYADVASPENEHSDGVRADLLELSAAFGDTTATKMVLDAIPEARKIEDDALRRGKLWESLADEDPLFEAIAGAWTHAFESVGPWIESLPERVRRQHIVRNLSVSHHNRYELAGAEKEAWQLISDECLFDMTYIGALHGPAAGSTSVNAIYRAVEYLRKRDQTPTASLAEAWLAACAAADDKQYDGRAHLKLALKMADSDPQTAFKHLVNAVYFSAATNKEVIPSVLAAARKLAKHNQWTELGAALEWAGS